MRIFVPVSRLRFSELHVAPITTRKFNRESKITRFSTGAIGTGFRILPRHGWVAIDTRIFGYTGHPTRHRRIPRPITNVMVFGPTTIPVRASESKAGFGGALALKKGFSRTIDTHAIIITVPIGLFGYTTPLLKGTHGFFAGVKFTILRHGDDRGDTVGTSTPSSSRSSRTGTIAVV